MSVICSYEGCMVRRLPCSSVAFFAIPNDNRRQQWIVNSGNKDLTNLDVKRTRLFCENHFHNSDIRSQFHRKTLRRCAIPIPYRKTDTDVAQSMISVSREEQNTNCALAEDSIKATNSSLDGNSNQEPCYEIDYLLSEDAELKEILISAQDDESQEFLDPSHDDDELTDEETTANMSIEEPEESAVKDKFEEQESRELIRHETIITSNNTSSKLSEAEKNIHNSDRTYNDDKHFALSLVGYFQRLNMEKKAIAKLKILQYLTALELGKNCDI